MVAAQSPHDRNLLFGVLALQLDFVSQQQLVDTMQDWLRQKHKSLGELFVERGILSEERSHLLWSLVKEHVRQHGDDPQLSLAAVPVPMSLRAHVQSMGNAELAHSVTLCSLAPAGVPGNMPIEFTRPHTTTIDTTVRRRFEPLRPLAEGGLGVVSVANDTELTREVALKEIKPKFADHLNSRARFMQEAEITGRLEHPGIVPVYGLGTYPDGRPYYAMRMIRGKSLQDAIDEFHREHDTPRSSGDRILALRDLIQRFIDVCNAIEYAHSRGIVHRDLKPANIMLGKFRETLVVDWGLAKSVGQTEVTVHSDETVIVPELGSESTPTRMGEVVGTVAFMSPEQAAGRQKDVGPASDIYSLGATLYAMLTGTVAQKDADFGRLLRNVIDGKFPHPREVKLDVPRALEAICLKAMARDPQDRYASAAALASDLEHFLADEPVTAHREPPTARLRRWTRHHPKIFGSLAAAVLTGLAGALILWGFAQVTNERLRKERALAERARVRADSVADFLVEAFSRTDPQRDGKTVTVYEVMRRQADRLEKNTVQDPRIAAALTQTIGRALLKLGIYAEAVPIFKQAYEISLKNFGPDDSETRSLKDDWMASQAMIDSTANMLADLADALQDKRARLGDANPETLNAMNNLAVAYLNAKEWQKTIELLEPHYQLAQSHLTPAELLGWENNLATAYQELGQLRLALPLWQRLQATGPEILGRDNPHTPLLLRNLANGLYCDGQLQQAAAMASEALAERRRLLAPDSPDIRDSLRLLLAIQLSQRDYAAAEVTGRQWLETLQSQTDGPTKEQADARLDLADALLGRGQLDEATALAQEAVVTFRQIEPDSAKRLRSEILLDCLRGMQETTPTNQEAMANNYLQLKQKLPELSLLRRWYVLRACEQISACYDHWQVPDEAARWQQQATQVAKEIETLRERPLKTPTP